MKSDESGFFKRLGECFFGKAPSNNVQKKTDKLVDSKSGIENFLYYFGASIIVSTMLWYIGNIWRNFQHSGLAIISAICFCVFTLTGNFFWNRGRRVAGGVLYTCSISVVPIFMWAFESVIGIMPQDLSLYSNFHTQVKSGWILMEVSTLAVGYIFMKYRKFPFMVAVISFIAYYLSQDIVPLFFGYTEPYIDLSIFFRDDVWEALQQESLMVYYYVRLLFALAMLLVAYKYDKQNTDDEDYSFWLYLFGAILCYEAIWSIFNRLGWFNSTYGYSAHAIIDAIYIGLYLVLKRRVFILGAPGLLWCLGHIVHRIFTPVLVFQSIFLALGSFLILNGILEDRIRKLNENYDSASWFYITGSTTFWATSWWMFYSLGWANNEFGLLCHAILDLFFMISGVVLQRRVFILWGALGFWGYLGHLAYRTFADTLIFPLVLISFGMALIATGVYYSRYCEQIENNLRAWILKKK